MFVLPSRKSFVHFLLFHIRPELPFPAQRSVLRAISLIRPQTTIRIGLAIDQLLRPVRQRTEQPEQVRSWAIGSSNSMSQILPTTSILVSSGRLAQPYTGESRPEPLSFRDSTLTGGGWSAVSCLETGLSATNGWRTVPLKETVDFRFDC